MQAPVPFRYRLIVGAVLLIAFAFFWCIYQFAAHEMYQRILELFGIWTPRKMAFVDFHAILSAAECHRRGFDVYVTNPCDIAGRPHLYSPLWLMLMPSFLGTTDTWWTGAALAILFLLSLAWLCPAKSPRELLLFLVMCCSSAVLFAAATANVDVIIFMLALLAGKLFATHRYRPISYGAILLAAALKFYPFSAFIVLITDRQRRTLVIGALAAMATLGLAFAWRKQIAVAAGNFPALYMADYFSARNLIGSLPKVSAKWFSFLEPHIGILTSGLMLLSMLGALGLAVSLRRSGCRLFLGLQETVLFLCGGAMIAGCFFAGHNVHYRAILLLLTVPLLLAWTRDESPVVRLVGWTAAGLVAFAVLQLFVRTTLFNTASAAALPVYRIGQAYWLLEEMAWWSLVVGLMSTMLLIAWESPAGVRALSIADGWVGALDFRWRRS